MNIKILKAGDAVGFYADSHAPNIIRFGTRVHIKSVTTTGELVVVNHEGVEYIVPFAALCAFGTSWEAPEAQVKNAVDMLVAHAIATAEAAGEPFPTKVDPAQDGVTTSLMHRQHQWSAKYYAPLMPLCTICGGRCDPRQAAHELCVARQKLGQATPALDTFHKCACMACVTGTRTPKVEVV